MSNLPLFVKPIWIVAVSGHRPKLGVLGRSPDEIEACRASLREVLTTLQAKASELNGSFELLASVAEGVDLLAVSIAEEIGMPVHLNLPLSPEEFARDFENKEGTKNEAWKFANKFIETANDPSTDWTIRTATGASVRPDCYYDTNLQMLEAADLIVAVNNGIDSDAIGGSSEVIKIADELSVPLIIIDPTQSGKIVRMDSWGSDGVSEKKLSELNSDLALVESHVESTFLGESENQTQMIRAALDRIASDTSGTLRSSLTFSIWLHFAATVVATITVSFIKILNLVDWKIAPLMTAVELTLVSYAFWLIWGLSKKHFNSRWRRARLASEISDSLIHCAGLVDPLQTLVVKHDGTWKRFALSIALSAHRETSSMDLGRSASERRELLTRKYLEKRIGNQTEYFDGQLQKSSKRFKLWMAIANYAYRIAIPVVLIAFVLKLIMHWYDLPNKDLVTAVCVYALPIIVPLIAGLASSIIAVGDVGRRATRYRQVSQRLNGYRQLIPTLGTYTATQRVILEVEDILLDEMIEWHAAAENVGH